MLRCRAAHINADWDAFRKHRRLTENCRLCGIVIENTHEIWGQELQNNVQAMTENSGARDRRLGAETEIALEILFEELRNG